jgi:type IV pilus assembly protein PilW
VVLDLLARDIRMSGYQGCADPEDTPPAVIANSPPTTNFQATAIGGSEISNGTWAPTAPSTLPGTFTDENGNTFTPGTLPLTNTDVIRIQFADALGAQNTIAPSAIAGATGTINITTNPGNFAANNFMMIADCDSSDIFKATAVTDNTGSFSITHDSTTNSSSGNLSKAYATGSRVMRFESNLYLVAPAHNPDGSNKTNKRGSPVNALYRVDGTGNLISMLEGVDNLQVLYGERLTNGNLHYLPANDATINMQNVDSIKLGVLMSTVEAVTNSTDSKIYNVAGTEIKPAGTSGATVTYPLDGRVRRVYTATVNLRNRQ